MTKKALALAEAGLRVRLGRARRTPSATCFSTSGAATPLPTRASTSCCAPPRPAGSSRHAIGAYLGPAAAAAGSARLRARDGEGARLRPRLREPRARLRRRERARPRARRRPGSAVRVHRRSANDRFDLPGTVFARIADPSGLSRIGLLTAVDEPLYRAEIAAREAGPIDLAVTLPRGDGTVVRGVATGVELAAGERAWVSLNLARPRSLLLERDTNGDGMPDATVPLALDGSVETSEGPRLLAARVVGPETIAGASPLGLAVALLYDRVVDAAGAADPATYTVPSNRVQTARRQLSGRLVFASLEQPEGNEIPTSIDVEPLADLRGHVGPAATGVELRSLIDDPGAVVTGRVLNGDGTPLAPGVRVTYLNTANTECSYPNTSPGPVSQVPVAGDGSFEFRYVRRDPCGAAFKLVTQDPLSAAVREITRFVRAGGERIAIDIALFARGIVDGHGHALRAAAHARRPEPARRAGAGRHGRGGERHGSGERRPRAHRRRRPLHHRRNHGRPGRRERGWLDRPRPRRRPHRPARYARPCRHPARRERRFGEWCRPELRPERARRAEADGRSARPAGAVPVERPARGRHHDQRHRPVQLPGRADGALLRRGRAQRARPRDGVGHRERRTADHRQPARRDPAARDARHRARVRAHGRPEAGAGRVRGRGRGGRAHRTGRPLRPRRRARVDGGRVGPQPRRQALGQRELPLPRRALARGHGRPRALGAGQRPLRGRRPRRPPAARARGVPAGHLQQPVRLRGRPNRGERRPARRLPGPALRDRDGAGLPLRHRLHGRGHRHRDDRVRGGPAPRLPALRRRGVRSRRRLRARRRGREAAGRGRPGLAQLARVHQRRREHLHARPGDVALRAHRHERRVRVP